MKKIILLSVLCLTFLFGGGCMAKLAMSRIMSLNIEAKKAYEEGAALSKQNMGDRAIKAYTRSIEIDPNSAAYNNRCVEYNRKGLYDRAISDADKAIMLTPQYAMPYFNRGNSYYRKNDMKRALRDYLKAVELDAAQPEFFFNLGMAYFKTKDLAAAVRMYQKAVELKKDYIAAYYNLACAYALLLDNNKALENLKRAVDNGFDRVDMMRSDITLEGLRGTEGFEELILRMKEERQGN